MNIVFLLILIPIYIVSLVFNIGSVINIINNDIYDYVYFMVSLFIIYIAGFFLINVIKKCFNDLPLLRNINNDELIINNSIVILLSLLFAGGIIIGNLRYEANIVNIMISISIILVSIFYILGLKKVFFQKTLKLISIDDKEKSLDLLLFSDDQNKLYEFAVEKGMKYKEDSSYVCVCSMQNIYKIVKEVKDLDKAGYYE